MYSPKYNSAYNHYCLNNWQQKWVHPKWTCQNFVQSVNILLGHHCYLAPPSSSWAWNSPELHRLLLASSSTNDITELLDVRHTVLLHLPLEDAPHMLNRVQVWRHTWPLNHLQQQISCHLGGVFAVVMLENSFWREGIHWQMKVGTESCVSLSERRSGINAIRVLLSSL